MIIDCYTHTWQSQDQLGACAADGGNRIYPFSGAKEQPAHVSQHLIATEPVDYSIVLGFKSLHLGADVSNDFVSSYVATRPDRLVGFAGIDPSEPNDAIAELRRGQRDLSMPGLAIAPAAQDFHPSNSKAMQVYQEAADLNMPILFHTGIRITEATKLEYAQPVLLDEVAREIPSLKIIIGHMGFPWMNETMMLLAKHPNVYAETSWIVHQPWQAYHALISAYQCGVIDKVLFGSGFPFGAASGCIEALYSINHLCQGTNLPAIPREHLRGIVERDSFDLLGISVTQRRPKPVTELSPSETK